MNEKPILIDDIPIARAKSIALATQRSSSINQESVQVFYNEIKKEVSISFIASIEIPQRPVVDIKSEEPISIVCKESDLFFPEVYAIRKDFPLGLPHTNMRESEHPVSLCVTEEDFREARIRFSPDIFLEIIRDWLAKAARGHLHADDQVLEPFFHSDRILILPSNYDWDKNNQFEISNIDGAIYTLSCAKNNVNFSSLNYFKCDPVISGFIRKQPNIISDLKLLNHNGKPLINELYSNINNLLSYCCRNLGIRQAQLCFMVDIPIKRNIDSLDNEIGSLLVFRFKLNLWEIGVSSGIFNSKHKSKELNERKFQAISLENLLSLEIEQYTTIFGFNSEYAALYNGSEINKGPMTIIGVGSLGSNLLNTFVRGGFGIWTVIDNDRLYPHNLARHILSNDSIGKKKCSELSNYFNKLVSYKVCSPVDSDFTAITSSCKEYLAIKDSSLILDCSTSIQVSRILAIDLNDIMCRRVSIFLSPTGRDLVLLAEDGQRNHRLDLLEMMYYRQIIETEGLHDHLIAPTLGKIRYSRNSCREITSRISYADVNIHAAIASKEIMKLGKTSNAIAAVWKINDDSGEIKRYSISISDWVNVEGTDGWSIYIDQSLLSKLISIRKFKWDNEKVETGGVLLGSYDVERKIVYLYADIKAPIDSIEKSTSYIRGAYELEQNVEKIRTITAGQTTYLGEWHSHPSGCSTKMSSDDKKLFNHLTEEVGGTQPIVMMIIGDTLQSVYIYNLN